MNNIRSDSNTNVSLERLKYKRYHKIGSEDNKTTH